jgi:trehalose 6-phosphate phosphatase
MTGDGLTGHALYLDVDGTLLDLALTPESVTVPVGLLEILERLSAKLEGAVAFVSGRPIAAIDRLFRPLQLAAIGVHGGEMRPPGGRICVDERMTGELQAAVPALRAGVSRLPGVILEDKRFAIALHYRQAPVRGREVLRLAELVAHSLGGEFGVLLGKCVVEIRPRHLTKGAALRRLMEFPPFHGRTPIFAGDDTADEDAFEEVNRLGGVSVRVGDGAPTAAGYQLPGPEQLRGWLLEIARGQELL